MTARRPVIAFVHGCTQGPSGWVRVRDHLTVEGVDSIAIDLEPQRFDAAGAMECSQHIPGTLRDIEHVVLVGTSCTGIIVPVVTMVRSIDHLVFMRRYSGHRPIGHRSDVQDGVLHYEWVSWGGSPYSPDAARRFMFNDCHGEILEWSLTTVRAFLPQPAYDEITPLIRWPDVSST